MSIPNRLARVVQAHWFTTTILVAIVANAVVLGLETYAGIDERYGDQLVSLDDLCFVVFVVELALRIGAYGRRPWDFFRDGWNVFDFVVIASPSSPGVRQSSTLLRLARLARVVRDRPPPPRPPCPPRRRRGGASRRSSRSRLATGCSSSSTGWSAGRSSATSFPTSGGTSGGRC